MAWLKATSKLLFRDWKRSRPVKASMKRFVYELEESWRIAYAQMRSNMTRSTLTALGVIIGIIAVTLMGTAVNGIGVGFDKSMAGAREGRAYCTGRASEAGGALVEFSRPRKN